MGNSPASHHRLCGTGRSRNGKQFGFDSSGAAFGTRLWRRRCSDSGWIRPLVESRSAGILVSRGTREHRRSCNLRSATRGWYVGSAALSRFTSQTRV